MKDLQVGRQVPPQELARLMPLSEVPTEPATIEQATEQGARDATLYFAELSQVANQQRSGELLQRIDWEQCHNCAMLMDTLDNADLDYDIYWEKQSIEIGSFEHHDYDYPLYLARVDFEWKRSTEVDTDTNTIKDIQVNDDNSLFYGVAFYDGRWRPLYLNGANEATVEN